jgi:hypothetical protein
MLTRIFFKKGPSTRERTVYFRELTEVVCGLSLAVVVGLTSRLATNMYEFECKNIETSRTRVVYYVVNVTS